MDSYFFDKYCYKIHIPGVKYDNIRIDNRKILEKKVFIYHGVEKNGHINIYCRI